MREIRFRGKRIDNGDWVYGGYHKHIKRQLSPIGDELKDDDVCHLIIQSGFADWNMPKPLQAVEVDPETVGQYTGIHDKNGKEIYESDVISIMDYGYVKVAFSEGCFGAFDNHGFSPFRRSIWGIGGEVIGNIYENPELLEVSQ